MRKVVSAKDFELVSRELAYFKNRCEKLMVLLVRLNKKIRRLEAKHE